MCLPLSYSFNPKRPEVFAVLNPICLFRAVVLGNEQGIGVSELLGGLRMNVGMAG